MEGLVLLLGIICCLQIGWNNAATVRVSKAGNAKVGDQVALECYGSEDSLSFYIGNQISWSYVNMHNEVIPITEGFYCTGPSCKNGHYAISHVGLAHEHLFNLTITAVNDADDGYYKCSLLDVNGNVTDSKTVKMTVVHRVEKVNIEILGVPGAVSSSTSPTRGNHSIRLTPGRRQVKCTASGSNPSPVLGLAYNELTSIWTMEGQKNTTGDRVKYTTSFTKDIDFSVAAGEQQTLACHANIPQKQFSTKSAGLRLTVAVESNGTAQVFSSLLAAIVASLLAWFHVC